ncbi:MAG: transcription-repair coupling factor, partial [Spirochaetaceae bacterium]|nr:transcription-repair coupling factor [Spirochaetaceae bacterium]
MNTLLFPAALDKITGSAQVRAVEEAYAASRFPLEIEGAEGALRAMLTVLLYKKRPALIVVVTPTDREAEDLCVDLAGFSVPVLRFPWWGTMPYREMAPLSAVFGERSAALSHILEGGKGIAVLSQRAFLTPLPPPEYFKSLLYTLEEGGAIDTGALAARLVSLGYTRVPKVQVPGEFALRGEVCDVFMGGDERAFRLLFDYDRLESIKAFDPIDQSGQERLTKLTIRPLKELIWSDGRIEALEKNLASFEEFSRGCGPILEELIERRAMPGEELFFPLAFDSSARPGGMPATILDYMGGDSVLVFMERERLENAQSALRKEYESLYIRARRGFSPAPEQGPKDRRDKGGKDKGRDKGGRDRGNGDKGGKGKDKSRDKGKDKGDKGKGKDKGGRGAPAEPRGGVSPREVPAPSRILLDFAGLAALAGKKTVSFMDMKEKPAPGVLRLALSCDSARSFFGNINYLKEEFSSLSRQGWKLLVAAESDAQALRLLELLKDIPSLDVITLPLSAGFALPDIKLMVVQENEIFGRRKRPLRSLKTVRSAVIDTFVELNPGDYVVHVNYGIGFFKGIERVKALGHERDYVKLQYSGEETVFVPIEQVNLVQRYIGSEGGAPRLDKLGSKNWENRKGRVKQSVEETAEKLLSLYSKRKASTGFAFPHDTEWQTMFEAAFPFDETPDQLRCVEEIKEDMESPHPMDRLVCGDVGYGKTEVAVRACFKAVMGGKQVAFLAPTTILAEQHYENFQERFKQFPVTLGMLSRFVDRSTTRKTLEAAGSGAVDILVGTHRIIQKDVRFKDLGLMIIDEEQRFGVKDKERLKELKTNVDCLSLSATPIPRTLHMSLLKIRDMSLLATAPRNRHPIETIIGEYNEEELAAAIRREVERGGQIFFLHNRVETLDKTRMKIEHLVPEMLVETAHGQMDSRDLEDVMHRFIHGGFHVLVSTTIIENGIDIPNVNTIIIDRSDMYGVSQLYQLRGRVGRSDRVAYAYLFYPKDQPLTELAMKRLAVISDFTELGSGFKVAMKDMEIRGAGNLLGREQSGDIYSVGFDLYVRLLDEAIQRLADEHYQAPAETRLELEYSGFIPDSYIDSVQEKMEVYKKIASITSKDELERVYAELLDRFGPLPDEAASLLALSEIRIICREIAVVSLKERDSIVQIEFGKVSKVKIDRLVRLMQESSGKVKLDPRRPNILMLNTGNIGLKEKSEFIREKLAALS